MEFENPYALVDRLLHRLSFRTVQTQIELADLEERFFGGQLADIAVRRPVFITALPRAGTTLLLELCAGLDEFATHCYRDMPFVLLPLIWNRFSSAFRRNNAPRERAHGDGMLVSIDSPETIRSCRAPMRFLPALGNDRLRTRRFLDAASMHRSRALLRIGSSFRQQLH